MNKVDLEKLNLLIETFVNERDWDQFHSIKNLTMALSVECSELVEIFQWQTEASSNTIPHDSELHKKMQDELADIFYYLIRLSAKANINLEEALKQKLKKNAEKYPVELAKGSSKKYNEL